MEVILRTNVDGLGREGEVVKVADGYARNFLIPKQLAMFATEKSRRILEHSKQVENIQEAKERLEAEKIVAQLAGVACTITRLSGENDRLFGSVTSMDIAESLQQQGFEVDRRKIDLEDNIRELGTYSVPLRLMADVVAHIRVDVVQQQEES